MTKIEIIKTLYRLLCEVNSDFQNTSLEDLCLKSLSECGMDSMGILTFMVYIEDEMGIEWDEDKTTPDVLKNFDSIADYILLSYANTQ